MDLFTICLEPSPYLEPYYLSGGHDNPTSLLGRLDIPAGPVDPVNDPDFHDGVEDYPANHVEPHDNVGGYGGGLKYPDDLDVLP